MLQQEFLIANQEYSMSLDNYRFAPNSRKWKLSRDVLLNLEWVDEVLAEPLRTGFISALSNYARINSAKGTKAIAWRFKRFVLHVSTGNDGISSISPEMIISYRGTLNRQTEYYLGSVSGFLKKWHALGFPGLSDSVVSLLKNMRLKGAIKGLAVQTLDPIKGPLSDLEYESLNQCLLDSFERGDIGLEDFVLVVLFIATGRRPIQLGDLKSLDFIEGRSSDGLSEFVLNVPRRKQQGTWRMAFRPVALTPEIGIALRSLILENTARVEKELPAVSELEKGMLPIFPNWEMVQQCSAEPKSRLYEIFESDALHRPTSALSRRFGKSIKFLEVVSERTGETLHLFPLRLRRTLATRAAREGYGSLVIAELLDHTDDQNARVYTENVPEHVDAINEAVAFQLAPLAQAFAGVLVDHREDAIRGDDPNSGVRSDSGEGVGTCGHHGFCGGLAPVACYTCKSFQPWLDGPHEEVLQGLLSERERIQQITRDNTMTTINDRTIFAVAEVVRRCEERREELRKNG